MRQTFEPHDIGEIWTSILNEMFWELVKEHGFAVDLINSTQPHGNIVAIQLIIGGMMLQPCSPTFIDARDAIIQADDNYYNGQHKCLLWKAFAKRGLGVNASSETREDDFDVPGACYPSKSEPLDIADLHFLPDFTSTISQPLRQGTYVRVAYDLVRLEGPCEFMLLCYFMDQDQPICKRFEFSPNTIYTIITLTRQGWLSIYFHVRLI